MKLLEIVSTKLQQIRNNPYNQTNYELGYITFIHNLIDSYLLMFKACHFYAKCLER